MQKRARESKKKAKKSEKSGERYIFQQSAAIFNFVKHARCRYKASKKKLITKDPDFMRQNKRL